MSSKDARIEEVKKTIDDLIQTATSYDTDVLDTIYHDDMCVYMVGSDDHLETANKTAFMTLFKSKREAGDPPMNTWAKYHHIDVENDKAHVILSRKNNLSGQEMNLFLSIDLTHSDHRWQVVREVIFLHPTDVS